MDDSTELPNGYAGDDVFDIVVPPQIEDNLSAYSSDDGGEFQENTQPQTILVFHDVESSSDDEIKDMEAYIQQQKGDGVPWNDRFQELVESAYFRKGEQNYSAERQYELSIALRHLCVEFAKEASKIGVHIVQQMVRKNITKKHKKTEKLKIFQ